MNNRKEYLRQYYLKNRERIIKKTKNYNSTHKIERSQYDKKYRLIHKVKKSQYMKVYMKHYFKAHRVEINEYQKQYRVLKPKICNCHNVVNRLIQSGKLIRQPCSICGKPKAHAHHHNYNKPLDVIWLCKSHHKQLHANLKQVIDS